MEQVGVPILAAPLLPEDPLERGRRLLAAGELSAAFQALGTALLARPLDPAPLGDLERIAAVLDAQGALADLYARLLQENPDHPSLGTLTRRIGRLRASVLVSEGASLGPEPEGAGQPALSGPALVEGGDRLRPAPPVLMRAGEGSAPDEAGPSVGIAFSLESGSPLVIEEELQLREAMAGEEGPRGADLAAVLFGAGSEADEAIDYELGALLTSGGTEETATDEGRASGAGEPGSLILLLRRGLALAVDGVLLAVVPLLILALTTGSLSHTTSGLAGPLLRTATVDGTLVRAALVLALLFAFVYCTLCWALGGRTLGGFVAGVRAVDERGDGLSVGKAALRAAAAVLGSAFLIGAIWALFDPRHQALHDRLAKTSVISG